MREGVSFVERSRDVIGFIGDQVHGVDSLVASCGARAEQHAEALCYVVDSVAETDLQIQQNVKVGDTSAVSVKQLHDRATALVGLVRHFQIDAAQLAARLSPRAS